MATLPNGQHLYTEEEDEWLRENHGKYKWSELSEAFNKRFGTNIKCGVSDHARKTLNLHKDFNPGNAKKGMRINTNTLPVGTVRFYCNRMYIKIADNINDCQNRKMPNKDHDQNWLRLDYKVWAENGNELPKNSNEMLIHLNGDHRDCSIENLYKTTRTINLLMAKNGWYSEDREVTKTALKWCELFYAIKGSKNKGKERNERKENTLHEQGREGCCSEEVGRTGSKVG